MASDAAVPAAALPRNPLRFMGAFPGETLEGKPVTLPDEGRRRELAGGPRAARLDIGAMRVEPSFACKR
jgi:hypothetical protein